MYPFSIVFVRLCAIFIIIGYSSTTLSAQLASPVFDANANAVGAITLAVAKTAKALREDILPFKETVSKVQQFFKDAKTTVNGVVVNLKLTQQVIEMESNISQLFLQSLNAIDQTENIPYVWKHRWRLAQLWYESRNILEVFDFSYLQNKAIMDDHQRIILIKETLRKLRRVHAAMRISLRRTQRLEYKIKTKKRQIQTYSTLFE